MFSVTIKGTINTKPTERCLFCSNNIKKGRLLIPINNNIILNEKDINDEYFVCSKQCAEYLKNLFIVSLDPFRSKDVKIFSGEMRGIKVAEHIAETYSNNVSILIPNDIISISRSFRNGFNSIMFGKFPTNVSIYQMSRLLK